MSENEISGTVGQSVQAGAIQGDVHVHASGGQDAVPRQLPGAARHFVNRAVEQDALSTVLNGAGGDGVVLLSTIDGTAGVGKSTLAVHWAHQRRDLFPDGELYVNLRGFDPVSDPMDPTEALGIFLAALGVPAERLPEDQQARAALFRSSVHGKRMLLLLDNARTAEQVRPLLPANSTCLVLVTSRNRFNDLVVHEGAARVGVQVLTNDEAHDLLGRYLGRDRLTAEPDSVRALVEHCAGLPLALGIVAVRAAEEPDFPLDELVGELRDERARLDALDAGGQTGVRAVFSWSYRSLSSEAARAFRLLGLPTGPDIGLAAATDLLGTTKTKARNALAELTRAHLLYQHQPGRYEFHDLLRAYAAECAAVDESPDERQAAIRRLLDHYLRTSAAAQEYLVGHSRGFKPELPASDTEGARFEDEQTALMWWETERWNLHAATRQAVALGLDVHAWQVPYTLMYLFHLRGYIQEWIELDSIAIEAVRRLGAEQAEGHLLHDLGLAYYDSKQYGTALEHMESSLRVFRMLDDQAGELTALMSLGPMAVDAGRPDDVEEHLQHGLILLGDDSSSDYGRAQLHNGLGIVYTQAQRFEDAISHLHKAFRNNERAGEQYGNGFVMNNLGDAHFALNDLAGAADCYRQAMSQRHRLGHKRGEATSARSLGTTLVASDDVAGAGDAWRRSVDLLEELEDSEAEEVRVELDRLPLT